MKYPFLMIVLSTMPFWSLPAQPLPYSVRQWVTGSGGGAGGSSGYSAMSTTGQSTAGTIGPSSYSGAMGLWAAYPSLLRIQALTMLTTTEAGWNLLSVPVQVTDHHAKAVFPSSAGDAFQFTGRYAAAPLLGNGTGYWLMFRSPSVDTIYGMEVPAETVAVKNGWNLFGVASASLAASSIIPIGNTIISDCYGYSSDSGYTRKTILSPGRAYWVKVSGDGGLGIGIGPEVLARLNSGGIHSAIGETAARPPVPIVFTDAKGRMRTLYIAASNQNLGMEKHELPPLPPDGTPDVRFSTNSDVETIPGDGTKESVVQLSSVEYPVIVRWKEGIEGAALDAGGSVWSMNNAGSARIPANTSGVIIRLSHAIPLRLPVRYALSQNYPNPWNPSTTIHFELPQDSHVELKIYNLIGQEVRTLIDENRSAGRYNVRLDGSGLPSGLYFYRITAGGFRETRKMTLLK